jgi:2-oxoglutarate ferredoxin oxidoreductase subunit gamma
MEKRIIVAGSGGQGILFLGRLIAYSGMLEGKQVTWFPAYGAEIRGGTANCTIIISDEMIGSPVIRNPDILVIMNEASLNRFAERLLQRGVLIYDSSLIKIPIPSHLLKGGNGGSDSIDVIEVPASELSASFKNTKSANMVMMGALIAAAPILSIDSSIEAIAEITPAHRKESLNINKELIMKGYDYVVAQKSHSISHL